MFHVKSELLKTIFVATVATVASTILLRSLNITSES